MKTYRSTTSPKINPRNNLKIQKIETLPPKVLDGGESVNGTDRAAPGGLLGLGRGVIEPEGPRVLQRVR